MFLVQRYTWSASNNDLTGFIASGNETNINQLVQLIDPMSTSGSISIIILPTSSNGCVGDPVSVTILVKTKPKSYSNYSSRRCALFRGNATYGYYRRNQVD